MQRTFQKMPFLVRIQDYGYGEQMPAMVISSGGTAVREGKCRTFDYDRAVIFVISSKQEARDVTNGFSARKVVVGSVGNWFTRLASDRPRRSISDCTVSCTLAWIAMHS